MINYRALIILMFVVLMFVALAVKLFDIQIIRHEYYSLLAERQQNRPETVKAERGLIKDRNNEVLTFTKDNISFYVDTRMMNEKKIDSIASVFAGIFGKEKEYYKKLISEGSRNVCLEKKVPIDKALKLKKIVIDGLYYEEDFTRVYPYGSLASHVLGYVNKEMDGTEGVEKVYNDKLKGIDGNYVFERDVLGRIVSFNESQSRPPVQGNTVVLTINKNYQKILEEELLNGLEKYGGQSAQGIILNPNTGEIYAMASKPDFDPANYNLFPHESRRNRILTDTYEPGSTLKAIALAAMIDQKLVREDEVIDTENGTYYIKRTKISDSHPHSQLTVREILEQSSNIGMAKLSTRIKDEVLYRYLRDFGFSNTTSIDLPGEAEGYLKKPASFSALTKPFLSFGYEVSVTPLQIITAYAALVNGGILYKPYLLKSIVDPNGKVIEETKPQKIRNVIDKSTSDLIKDMMIGVVEQGTGTAAQLDNVLVGGKTGTSQRLVDKSYSSRKHNSSFIGFFPAENPEVIILILIDSPEIGKYGGLVAAPIFKEVARRIIESDLDLIPNKTKIERKQNLIEQLMADIKSAPGKTSKSYLNPAAEKKAVPVRKVFNGSRATMPNLVSMSMRDAIGNLNALGLKYKVVGAGKVVSQSIEPGIEINRNEVCVIVCEPAKKPNSVRIN